MKIKNLTCEELDIILSILGNEIEHAKIIGRDYLEPTFQNHKYKENIIYSMDTIKKLRNRVRKVYRDTMLERILNEKKN